jgi:hypothetical protein
MDFQYFAEPIPHIILDNVFDETELKEIWQELDFLTYSRKMLTPAVTGSAFEISATGEKLYKKQNKALFLDGMYCDRNLSNIMHITRKFFDKAFLQKCADQNFIFKYLQECNMDTTLLSYYEENDHYDAHHDKAAITILTWLYKEPKQFTGGELNFSDYNYTIPLASNRSLIFPGVANHSVNAVKMNEGVESMKGFGRYVITNFASFRMG